eukprot:1363229-Alexandrium_andersonii.AAC.1
MSASLVGSEMCIRDSFDDAGPGEPMSTSCPDDAGRGEAMAGPQSAVSYTHLRLPTICSV